MKSNPKLSSAKTNSPFKGKTTVAVSKPTRSAPKIPTQKSASISSIKSAKSPSFTKSKNNLPVKNKITLIQKPIGTSKHPTIKKHQTHGLKFQNKAFKTFQVNSNRPTFNEVHTLSSLSDKNKRIDFTQGVKRPHAYSVKNTRWDKVKDPTWQKYVREAASLKGNTTASQKWKHIKGFNGNKISASTLVIPKLDKSPNARQKLKEIKSYARTKGVNVRMT